MNQNNIRELIINEYNETPQNIVKLNNALTTHAYRVKLKNNEIIVKVAYDKNDIEEGKGDKENYVLKLIKEIAPQIPTPIVNKYFPTYNGFPGYIIILDTLPGKTLEVNDFIKIGIKEKNLNKLTEYMHEYHKYSQELITDFAQFRNKTFKEYIEKYKSKFAKTTEGELLIKLNLIDNVYEYFKNHKKILIHRDIKFNNLLIDKGEISGIIDWEGAFLAPLAFEFAHISTLAPKYGFSKWSNELIKTYSKKYSIPELEFEVKIAELFCYFRWYSRTFNHMSKENDLCIETGEYEIDFYKRKILEWNEI